jgi:hypothetical protein
MGSYTINFVHNVQIADQNISSGGQAVYTFAVKAETKNNHYPITITFAVKRDGGFELPPSGGAAGSYMAPINFDFSDFKVSDHEYGAEYGLYYPTYQLGTNTRVFDEDNYKIWEKSKGGDGFYHVYDEEKYAQTGGYGPILYAAITSTTRFIDKPIAYIEYVNQSAASLETQNAALSIGGVNYKHFIEGYTLLSTYGKINGGTYYCSSDCTCHKYDASDPDSALGWACTTECQNCTKNCRRCPAELIGVEGYASYANSDGLVPVTEELKDFLYAFASKQQYFYDGKGYLDGSAWDGWYYQAPGGSEWLFACCYYELK